MGKRYVSVKRNMIIPVSSLIEKQNGDRTLSMRFGCMDMEFTNCGFRIWFSYHPPQLVREAMEWGYRIKNGVFDSSYDNYHFL